MKQRRSRLGWIFVLALLGIGFVEQPLWAKPSNSTLIALSSNDRQLWVVNPDNDSVTLFDVSTGTAQKVKEIAVGDEPACVAITPDNSKVYVTNTVSGTVSVINATSQQVVTTIAVGVEPRGCALTPSGKKLYVANSISGDVSVIDTSKEKVKKTIKNAGPLLRGVAITDGDDKSAKVYVTQFQAQLRSGKAPADEGRDDSKEGRVTVISVNNDQVLGTVALAPLADTGFKSSGSTLDRLPRKRNDAGAEVFDFTTAAFPNLLEAIVIKGTKAYVVGTCSSPNGPVRFNVNVQSCLSTIDTTTDREAFPTLNMNKGVQFESVGDRLFNTNPFALALKNGGNEGFVAASATNRLVRVVIDAAGAPTINAPTAAVPLGQSPILRVEVGKNPRGIAITSTDTRAFVMNFLSRDISVIDLAQNPPKVIGTVASATLPAGGTLDAIVLRGHELFNTSVGPVGTAENALPPAGRMSDFGWGSCYGCHPEGLADGVTWMFPDGPRQTISMESTYEHPQTPSNTNLNQFGGPILPTFKQHALNWSAIRDEVQDFELNIRNVSGGQGLIAKADGSVDPCVFNLLFNVAPNAACGAERATEAAITTGRSADLDSIAAYMAFGIRAPLGLDGKQKDIDRGRALFQNANCQSCHGGKSWTRSIIDFSPPPTGETITGGQLVKFLRKVGTFDVNAANELKANTFDTVPPANGDLGINIPALLSINASAPYFHSGACPDLECVLNNVAHRSAGTSGTDTLTKEKDRKRLVIFLKSIDAQTLIFP